MSGYTTAPGDLEMGFEEKTIVLIEKKSPSPKGRIWKASMALLIVTLCFGGILLLGWYWNGRPDMMSESGHPEARIQKNATEKTDPHKLRQLCSTSKAAIHLEGNYDGDDEHVGTLKWKSGQGQAFVQGDFRLENNTIIIPHTGIYFVYSQALFRVTCNNDEGAAENLSHGIWRRSESIGGDVSLMSSIRSVCQNTAQEDERGWYSAIYLGAVFKLNKGDILWTVTNKLEQLEMNSGNTFFGVFAL